MKVLGRLRPMEKMGGSKDSPSLDFQVTIWLPVMRTLCSLQPCQTFTTWSYHRHVSGTQQPIPAGLQQGWQSQKSISWVPWGWTERKFFTMCRTNSYHLYLPLWCLSMHAFITTAALIIGREPHLKFASWLSWMTAVPERLTHEEWPHCLRAVSQNISASFRFFFCCCSLASETRSI